MECDNVIRPIGKVRNDFSEYENFHKIRNSRSQIEIFEEYADGLYRIEENNYLHILYHFDRSKDLSLKGKTYDGQVRGVFASRSPRRPTGLGLTTVKLLRREGNVLHVEGLDALDKTPVVDIKPYVPILDEQLALKEEKKFLKTSPRTEVHRLVRKRDLNTLLLRAGELHGHFCPGVSLGVIAATELMCKLSSQTDGLEDIIAVSETNNCFCDGIQYVTGCTLGNNSLIYRDMGKVAASLVRRNGEGYRASVLQGFRKVLEREFPYYHDLFTSVIIDNCRDEETVTEFKKASMEASFSVISLNIDELISIKPVKIELPDYAPIYETVICSDCGEGIMSTRSVVQNGIAKCLTCSNKPFLELNGCGMTTGLEHYCKK